MLLVPHSECWPAKKVEGIPYIRNACYFIQLLSAVFYHTRSCGMQNAIVSGKKEFIRVNSENVINAIFSFFKHRAACEYKWLGIKGLYCPRLECEC